MISYVAAFISVAITTGAVAWLMPTVALRYPFFTYYPAIFLSAFLGGLGPGLVAVAFSEICLWLIWLDPQGNERARDVGAMAGFFVTGAALAWAMEAMHRGRDRLQAALERERTENQTKDAFLTSLSHELRTPLNVVLGRLQLLQSLVTDEDARRGLEVVRRNAEAQRRLVEDLLDSQRIVQGRFDLNCDAVSLEQVAAAAIDALKVDIARRDIHFASRLEDVRLWGDPARLQQVFSNLLKNALKFTPPGGCVGLTVRRRGSSAIIAIEDSGVGISADFMPYVFERFRQADQSPSREHQHGLGLGLAIVKAIVEAHGGTATAESQGPGRGSCFTVRLPIRQPERVHHHVEPLAI